MKKNNIIAALTLSAVCLAGTAQAETASETRHPVIFAHGMGGWDSLAGYSYFGDDGWGTFVGDACSFLEMNGCNPWIARGQQANNKAEAFQVSALNTSEVRGEQLYNHVRNFMATTGATRVNFVAHSQGGFDIRKAAHRLKGVSINGVAAGTAKVGAMISVSSPHRGSPYAKRVLDLYARNSSNVFCGALPAVNGVDPCLAAAAKIGDLFYDFATGSSDGGNNIIAGILQLVYNDYDANDGKVTGARVFNQNYPIAGIAGYVGSFITGQDDSNLNPVMKALHAAIGSNADGDGYCLGDCDNDGAAGKGDGTVYDMDDDGLVPINSQHMGNRLQYTANDRKCGTFSCWDPLDTVTQESTTGYVSDLNNPSSTQMTSHAAKISQDHFDVFSLGPDTFDEHEFYASIIQYVWAKGY
jgi:pimeloyl-ACP methyl ester carboxylesterase